jgi:hypothetical protein
VGQKIVNLRADPKKNQLPQIGYKYMTITMQVIKQAAENHTG